MIPASPLFYVRVEAVDLVQGVRPLTAADISDEMANRAWDAYCEARDDGEDEPAVVMRAALSAAFSRRDS